MEIATEIVKKRIVVKMRNKIKPYIKKRLISEGKHPTADLYIYNYSPKAQYKNEWDDIIMMCRGLITDGEGNIKARPFKKFFNLGEATEIPNEKFKVYEKLDGSLGILYWVDNQPKITTRGSFTSEQALMGTKILEDKYKDFKFDKKYTYLFEIIYPNNKIVVDYKEKKDLILLAIINTETGEELPIEESEFPNKVRLYDGIKDISKLKNLEKDNEEGFVIRFESGLRLKVKFDEYVRLHRLVTETSARRIWEYLKEDKPIDELLERVPDEFYKWVKNTISQLKTDYNAIEDEAKKDFHSIIADDRKEFAHQAIKYKTRAILFKLLDKRDYSNVIWTMVKPKASEPFKDEI